MADIDIAQLRTWIGRRQLAEEVIAPTPAAALAATLDHADQPRIGDPLPPLWHWVYFTPLARQSELGVDGHPKLGGFMPPVPLPRRMWAGGSLQFQAPVRIGDKVAKQTEISDVTLKEGRQGSLVFVTLKHRLSTAAGLAIEEQQDIVYRASSPSSQAAPSAVPVPSEQRAALWRDQIEPNPTLLFRYSALTFNAHRIHYDLPYAREEEGYPGLVVHGPLSATLLADRLLAQVPGRLAEFSFRGQQPLFAGTKIGLCGVLEDSGAYALWAESPGGSVGMAATARME